MTYARSRRIHIHRNGFHGFAGRGARGKADDGLRRAERVRSPPAPARRRSPRIMKAMRSGGYTGSSGRYAAPVLRMPSSAATIPAFRSTYTPTISPGAAPRAHSSAAMRLAHASSSA